MSKKLISDMRQIQSWHSSLQLASEWSVGGSTLVQPFRQLLNRVLLVVHEAMTSLGQLIQVFR